MRDEFLQRYLHKVIDKEIWIFQDRVSLKGWKLTRWPIIRVNGFVEQPVIEVTQLARKNMTLCKLSAKAHLVRLTSLRSFKEWELEEGIKDWRRFKIEVAQYILINGKLFRRSITLRCVQEGKQENVLGEVHTKECGSHSKRTLTHQILRQKYF